MTPHKVHTVFYTIGLLKGTKENQSVELQLRANLVNRRREVRLTSLENHVSYGSTMMD